MACKLAIVSGMAFEAGIAASPGILSLYGLEAGKLERDIEQAVGEGVTHLLSFGTAAGILPSLKPGDIIVAGSVITPGEIFQTDTGWRTRLETRLPGSLSGDIAGVDAPLTSAQAKAALRQEKGVAAADMESHRVARIALRHGLPFACLRVVLDAAGTALPPAAMSATSLDGSVNYVKLAASLGRRPSQLPALIGLSADHAKARKALLRCRDFLAGGGWGLELG